MKTNMRASVALLLLIAAVLADARIEAALACDTEPDFLVLNLDRD